MACLGLEVTLYSIHPDSSSWEGLAIARKRSTHPGKVAGW